VASKSNLADPCAKALRHAGDFKGVTTSGGAYQLLAVTCGKLLNEMSRYLTLLAFVSCPAGVPGCQRRHQAVPIWTFTLLVLTSVTPYRALGQVASRQPHTLAPIMLRMSRGARVLACAGLSCASQRCAKPLASTPVAVVSQVGSLSKGCPPHARRLPLAGPRTLSR